MDYVIMGAQLLLSLSILIVLHEFGHFMPARWFNTRVEKFYLFFDAWGISLFKKKIGDTQWGIGWLPLGGYVKISGMIDESMDKEQMAKPMQDWEFRAKPAWQRLIIMLGGVTVNFILGFLIFAGVLFMWGDKYIAPENAKYGIATDSLAREIGLQDGDIIRALDNEKVLRLSDVRRHIFLKESKTIQVSRNQKDISLDIPQNMVSVLASYKGDFIAPRIPFVLREVSKSSHNKDAGLQANDQLISINGIATNYYHTTQKVLKQFKTQTVDAIVKRNGTEIPLKLKVSETGTIGVIVFTGLDLLDISIKQYGFLESIPAGVKKGCNFLNNYVTSLSKIFTGKVKASESLGGFGAMGSLFGGTWDWHNFWNITGIISLILAFMNLLPIPALDGGHVMFLLYEIISGRKPSDEFLEYATLFGVLILFSLLIFANGMDIWRAFFG